MGKISIYHCNKCGNEFKSQEGGGKMFIQYRCINCDTIKSVKKNRTAYVKEDKEPTKEEIGLCGNCGGELKEDLKPMCQKCKSRDVKAIRDLLKYD